MASNWSRVKEVFQSALELPVDARDAFLSEACGEDRILRDEVEQLLAADEGVDSIFDRTLPGPFSALSVQAIREKGTELEGRRLAHYEVMEQLGQGGMGKVFRARDLRLGRDVALKLLPPAVSDGSALERFRREAQALAAINDPKIVHVYSIEEADGLNFITMELVAGKPLGALIPKGGLSIDRFFELAVPLTEAVAAAHREGIVHRDLKPDNVMIGAPFGVKVLDFGLAKTRLATAGSSEHAPLQYDTTTLQTGPLVGTLPYMSPEQLLGRPADKRSDIFALGAVFCHLLTGRLPFDGDTVPELMERILECEPPSLQEEEASVPSPLRDVLHRCLARNPDDRFPDADALLHALHMARARVETASDRAVKRSLTKTGLVWGVANIPLVLVMAAHFPNWDRALLSILQSKPGLYLFLVALFPFVVFFTDLGVTDLLGWRRRSVRAGAIPRRRILESRSAMAWFGLAFGLVLALASVKTIDGIDFLSPPIARNALNSTRKVVDAVKKASPDRLREQLLQEVDGAAPAAASALAAAFAEQQPAGEDSTAKETVRQTAWAIRSLALEDGDPRRALEAVVRDIDDSDGGTHYGVFGAIVYLQFALDEVLSLNGIGPLQRALWWTNLSTVMAAVYIGVMLLFGTTTLVIARAERGQLPASLLPIACSLAFASVVLSVWPGLRTYTVLEADLQYPARTGPDLWIPYAVYFFCFTQAMVGTLAAPEKYRVLKAILILILLSGGYLVLDGDAIFFAMRTYVGADSTIQNASVSLVTIVGFLGSVSYWILAIRRDKVFA